MRSERGGNYYSAFCVCDNPHVGVWKKKKKRETKNINSELPVFFLYFVARDILSIESFNKGRKEEKKNPAGDNKNEKKP